MEIEERPPNGPNFGLIVALFGVTILVIFIVAYCALRWDHHLVPHHVAKHATSRLVMPVARKMASLLA
jgi:hypothetical protein